MTLRLLLCFYIAASLFAVYSSRLLGLGAQRALLVLALVLFVLAFIVAFARFSHRLHLPNIIFIFTSMATLCLAVVLSQWRLSTQLDRQLEQRIVARISGQVLGLPVVSADSTRFEFQIEHAQDEQGQAITLPFDHVRVSWRDAQALRMGQRCVLSLRLSRPRGFVNWAGFDYQAWLLAKGVGAVAYVHQGRASPVSYCEAQPSSGWAQWRSQLQVQLDQILPNTASSALIKALLMGDKSTVSAEQWRLFQYTGTVHLMAISGLHVGFIAVFTLMLLRLLLRPLVLLRGSLLGANSYVIYRFVSMLGSLAVAWLYAQLAGMSVPTQRAFWVLLLVYGCFFVYRRCRMMDFLLLVAAVILFINPMQASQAGFVLSFSAVACLFLAFNSRAQPNKKQRTRIKNVIYAQWVLLFGLLPMMAVLALPISVLAPLANLIAVPAVSFLVLPLLFLATLLLDASLPLALFLFELAAYLLDYLLIFLQYISGFQTPFFLLAQQSFMLWLLVVIAGLSTLTPRVFALRPLVLLLLVVLIQKPKPPVSVMEVLDVGQGLSVVLNLDGRHLVYDIGARFSDDFAIATHVLEPWLRKKHIQVLDYLIISHADNDHAGALQQFDALVHARHKLSGEVEKLALSDVQPCQLGPLSNWPAIDWQIDVLWPEPESVLPSNKANKANNRSCVLLIQSTAQASHKLSILLLGDIEKSVERRLLETGVLPERVDVFIAAHHGSNSSSTAAFLDALKPSDVIVSAGYQNRYKHPAEQVLQRFEQRGIRVWNTAWHGAVHIDLENDQFVIEAERCRATKPWYRDEGYCS